MPIKEFSEPVLQAPPDLSREQIERVAELTEYSRERVKTALEVCSRHGLGEDMQKALTRDLVVIFSALYGLSREQIERSRYVDIPF